MAMHYTKEFFCKNCFRAFFTITQKLALRLHSTFRLLVNRKPKSTKMISMYEAHAIFLDRYQVYVNWEENLLVSQAIQNMHTYNTLCVDSATYSPVCFLIFRTSWAAYTIWKTERPVKI